MVNSISSATPGSTNFSNAGSVVATIKQKPVLNTIVSITSDNTEPGLHEVNSQIAYEEIMATLSDNILSQITQGLEISKGTQDQRKKYMELTNKNSEMLVKNLAYQMHEAMKAAASKIKHHVWLSFLTSIVKIGLGVMLAVTAAATAAITPVSVALGILAAKQFADGVAGIVGACKMISLANQVEHDPSAFNPESMMALVKQYMLLVQFGVVGASGDEKASKITNGVFTGLELAVGGFQIATKIATMKAVAMEAVKVASEETASLIAKEINLQAGKVASKEAIQALSQKIAEEAAKKVQNVVLKQLIIELIVEEVSKELTKEITQELGKGVIKQISAEAAQKIAEKVAKAAISAQIGKMGLVVLVNDIMQNCANLAQVVLSFGALDSQSEDTQQLANKIVQSFSFGLIGGALYAAFEGISKATNFKENDPVAAAITEGLLSLSITVGNMMASYFIIDKYTDFKSIEALDSESRIIKLLQNKNLTLAESSISYMLAAHNAANSISNTAADFINTQVKVANDKGTVECDYTKAYYKQVEHSIKHLMDDFNQEFDKDSKNISGLVQNLSQISDQITHGLN